MGVEYATYSQFRKKRAVNIHIEGGANGPVSGQMPAIGESHLSAWSVHVFYLIVNLTVFL